MIEVFDVERYTSFNIRVRVCPTNVSRDGWNFGDSACGRGGAFLSARTVPQLSWGTPPGKQASKCLNSSN